MIKLEPSNTSDKRVTRKHWPPVRGPPYRPVHGPLLQTPLRTTPKNSQKIARNDKDLTYHLNGLTARVGVNSNAYFRRINRLGRKVILIAYCCLFRCGDVWKTTKDLYALKIKNFIRVLFCHRHFVWLSLPRSRSRTRPRPHEKQHDFSPLLWQPWMTGKNSWILITFILLFLWAIHIYLHLKQIANISIFLSLREMWRCVKYWTVMRWVEF